MAEKSSWLRIAEIIRPRPRIRPSEWAEANVRLTSEQSPARPGPFRCNFRPWTRAIHDLIYDNPDKRGIICVKKAQLGFSQAMINVMAARCISDPGPMLYVIGDDRQSKHFVSTYFDPTVRGSPALGRIFAMADEEARVLMQQKPYLGGRVDFVGGGSPGAVTGRPYIFAVMDELEVCMLNFPKESGDPAQFLKARVDTVKDTAKLCYFSHPKRRDAGILLIYDTWSDQRFWSFDCPRSQCGAPVEPCWNCIHIEGLKENGPRSIEFGSIDPRKAVFRCPTCKDVITDAERCRAVWEPREGGTGRFHSFMDPKVAAEREFVGVAINGLADPNKTVPGLVRELSSLQDEEKRQTFFNLDIGEGYSSSTEAVTVEHVRERLEASKGKILVPGGRYGCQFVTVGADAQMPESNPTYYCRAEAYDPRGVKFITHFEKCSGDDAFIEWLRFVEVPFAHESGTGIGGKFGVSVAAVDCGWITGRILDLCRRDVYSAATGQRIVLLPVRYQPHIKATMPAVMPSEQKRIDPARPHLGLQKRWDLHRETWFGREMNRWQTGRVELRCPAPPDLAAHITANVRVPGPDVHGWGNPDLIWEKQKNARDDWAQAGAYAEVAAVLEMGLDWLGEMLDTESAPAAQEMKPGWADRFRTRGSWWG